jgi:hypothetical protein
MEIVRRVEINVYSELIRPSGPLCEKVLGKAISWQPPGEQIFCGSMHSTIDAQLPEKVPKQKLAKHRENG